MKKNITLFLSIGIVAISAYLLGNHFYVKAKEALTVESNISTSSKEDDPPVNNSIQTIALKFNQPLDASTITGKVKLYKMDSKGNPIEEPCIVKIDQDTPTIIKVNNKEIDNFAQGEEYKIVISNSIKSTKGLTLKEDFIAYFATNYTFSLSVSEENNTRSQIVVISDLHLGVNDDFAECKKNRQALVDFLNQISNSPNVKELIIAGIYLMDGFCLWIM